MRGLQTAEATAKIDRTIGSFLQLLSPHFLHGAAHKALEFLIRRFDIHKYNVDAVLACALPYHGTRWFVRLVQLLRLKETCWGWLQGKQGMAPPARASFVARCRKDARVLKQLCLLGFGHAQETCSRGRVAFTTVVALEMLSAAPRFGLGLGLGFRLGLGLGLGLGLTNPNPNPNHPAWARRSCSCCCRTRSGSSRRTCPRTRRSPARC